MNVQIIEKEPEKVYARKMIVLDVEGEYRLEAEIYSHKNYGSNRVRHTCTSVGLINPKGGSIFTGLERIDNLVKFLNIETIQILRQFKNKVDEIMRQMNGPDSNTQN